MAHASSYITVKNVTDGPITVDRAGHQLGGGDFGTVDPGLAPARQLLEDGLLVEVDAGDSDTADLDPQAAAAIDHTDARNGDADAPATALPPTPADDSAATTTEA